MPTIQHKLSKPLILVLAIGATTIAATLATAEVKTKNSVTQLTVAEAKVNTGTPVSPSSRSTSNLRCWQYGELLFEETHLDDKKLSEKNRMLVFENSGSSTQREVYLIDVGSATCLYEKI